MYSIGADAETCERQTSVEASYDDAIFSRQSGLHQSEALAFREIRQGYSLGRLWTESSSFAELC